MPKPFIFQLHEAIAAVAPIDGVSVGDQAIKKTWRIDFDDKATAAQKSAAADVVAKFKPTPPENDAVLVEIADLEATQHRAMREALLGEDVAIDKLRAIDARIASLRATLKA